MVITGHLSAGECAEVALHSLAASMGGLSPDSVPSFPWTRAAVSLLPGSFPKELGQQKALGQESPRPPLGMQANGGAQLKVKKSKNSHCWAPFGLCSSCPCDGSDPGVLLLREINQHC